MILTDIHCHMLPGVDDGPRTGRMAAAMLKKSYKDGVRRIIVTPHYRAGMFEPEKKILIHRFLKMRDYAATIEDAGIELYLGCEYHRETDMVETLKKGMHPTMAGSRYVLVEFSSMDGYYRIRTVLYELISAGFIPIIAHAERYPAFVEHPENITDAIGLGARIQVNADALLGMDGFVIRHFCKKLMKNGQIDFIASDAHDMKARPSRLKECAEYVEKKWGRQTAVRIFEKNPLKIIGNNRRER